jgi:hypothetical protein
MSLLNLFWLFFAPTKGWRHLIEAKYSMHRLYLLHVIPLSLIPPLFITVIFILLQVCFLCYLVQNY